MSHEWRATHARYSGGGGAAARTMAWNAFVLTTRSGHRSASNTFAQDEQWRAVLTSTVNACMLVCVHSTRCASEGMGNSALPCTLCGRRAERYRKASQKVGTPTQLNGVVRGSHAAESLWSWKSS